MEFSEHLEGGTGRARVVRTRTAAHAEPAPPRSGEGAGTAEGREGAHPAGVVAGTRGCGLDGTQGLQGLPLTPPPPPGGPAHCPGLGPWLTLRARPGVERLGYENY